MPLPPPPTEVPPVAPSFPIAISEKTDVRADVAEVIQGPETQEKRAARLLTGVTTFILSYLAKTPLGQAGKPRDLAEKAIEEVKGGIEKIKGAKEGVREGIETIKELGQWLEKTFSTNPPVPALLAWVSSCLLLGVFLDSYVSKKEGKVSKAVMLILLTRLGIGAVEQWGSDEDLWGIAGSTAAVTTCLAIYKREWWVKLRKAFRKGGETLAEKMRAAWTFFDRDIMPHRADSDPDDSAQRSPLSSQASPSPSRAPVERPAPAQHTLPADETVDERAPTPPCAGCGAEDLGDRRFCQHCGQKQSEPNQRRREDMGDL